MAKIELTEFVSGANNVEVPLGFTGHFILPDKWTGGDFETLWKTSLDDADNFWSVQWNWAKNKVVEWEIEGLPSNPNQFKDDDFTWALISFVVRSVIQAMNSYMTDKAAELRKEIDFPTPSNLTSSEFMSWHKAMRKHQEDDRKSSLLKGWLAGKTVVRGWPDGYKPPAKDADADLALMMAVDGLLSEVMLPALNLGNWSAPLGGL